MAERTADQIAKIYKGAGDSVTLINTETSKYMFESEQDWKDRIKRNWQHLEIIKAYKKEDGVTSIWTYQDFTDINLAIAKGKLVQP
tara:strand:+ start:30 stop:287 length:258 start_codon:yes stop_codon:yes gene_type:complete